MRVLTFVVTCDYLHWLLNIMFCSSFCVLLSFHKIFNQFFACLYLTTMQILWARKYEYGVLFITHAREIFKSLVFASWLENSSSICDEQNTILTFPPHSIYTVYLFLGLVKLLALLILILMKKYIIWSLNLVPLLLKKRTLFSKILAVSVHESKRVSCSSGLSLQAILQSKSLREKSRAVVG